MNEYIVNRGNTYVYALSKETLAGKAKKKSWNLSFKRVIYSSFT
jgi:hypothetical protein